MTTIFKILGNIYKYWIFAVLYLMVFFLLWFVAQLTYDSLRLYARGQAIQETVERVQWTPEDRSGRSKIIRLAFTTVTVNGIEHFWAFEDRPTVANGDIISLLQDPYTNYSVAIPNGFDPSLFWILSHGVDDWNVLVYSWMIITVLSFCVFLRLLEIADWLFAKNGEFGKRREFSLARFEDDMKPVLRFGKKFALFVFILVAYCSLEYATFALEREYRPLSALLFGIGIALLVSGYLLATLQFLERTVLSKMLGLLSSVIWVIALGYLTYRVIITVGSGVRETETLYALILEIFGLLL